SLLAGQYERLSGITSTVALSFCTVSIVVAGKFWGSGYFALSRSNPFWEKGKFTNTLKFCNPSVKRILCLMDCEKSYIAMLVLAGQDRKPKRQPAKNRNSNKVSRFFVVNSSRYAKLNKTVSAK